MRRLKKRIKKNPYSSIAKLAWNESCRAVNHVTEVNTKFKALMRLLSSSGLLSEHDYKVEFINIVNSTWGNLLGSHAENFNECKDIIREAKLLKFMLADSCSELKELYRLSIARWS